MHDVQAKILELVSKKPLTSPTLRDIGDVIGVKNQPQKIKHHLDQLLKRGLIEIKKNNGRIQEIKKIKEGRIKDSPLLRIPIYGTADCGVPSCFADENLSGYLQISPSLLSRKSKNIFAVKALGKSMNRAEIGKAKSKLENGDYALVDPDAKNKLKNGQYVLSVIDGMANIKRVAIDKKNKQLVLLSESTENHEPIFIDSETLNDNSSYFLNGEVFQVIKKPQFNFDN